MVTLDQIPRGVIIAAPRSGSGKTLVTLALASALKKRGVDVRVLKSGPDYIDPAFHQMATGQPCKNLDSWAMPPPLLHDLLYESVKTADLFFIESSMGFFDGTVSASGACGSGADLARMFGLPVVLVLDVSGQAQSAAAVAHGFFTLDPSIRFCGVILNNVGSARHLGYVQTAMAAAGIRVLGSLLRHQELKLPERHLGLVQAREHAGLPAFLDRLHDMTSAGLEAEAVMSCARRPRLQPDGAGWRFCVPPPGQRIALACDDAFSFIYPHILEGWRKSGAEICFFSPLADEVPPDSCDSCWLAGGYPELYAQRLAHAQKFKAGLRHFATTRPVHGECGGYMVLGQALVDKEGKAHEMCNLLSHVSSYAHRKLHLGYREVSLAADTFLGRRGSAFNGHEFHYASLISNHDWPLLCVKDGTGTPGQTDGGQRGLVSGCFFHIICRNGNDNEQ